MKRCFTAIPGRLLIAAIICVVMGDRGAAQTGNAANGPWAGWVHCQLTAQLNTQADTYLNRVTHTWALTGLTPVSGTDIKVYPSTWTVVGQGTRQRQYADGRTVADQWATSGQAMPDTMTIRVSADGLVHINSAAQLRSTTATSGTSITRSGRDETRAPIGYYVDEWAFPVIQDVATKATIDGSTTGPATNIAPGQPPGTAGTAVCSWQFVRGATSVLLPPDPTSSATAAATASPAPKITLSAAGSGGTIQTASSGTTSVTTSKDTTLRQGTVSSGTNTVLNLLQGPAPTNVHAAAGPFQSYFGNFDPICVQRIIVSWDALPGATGYNIYIDGASEGRAGAGATSFAFEYTVPYIGLQTTASSVTSAARVGALFDDRLEGVSAPVSFTHIDKC